MCQGDCMAIEVAIDCTVLGLQVVMAIAVQVQLFQRLLHRLLCIHDPHFISSIIIIMP